MKKIGLDMDSVIANFYKGFAQLAQRRFGSHLPVLCGRLDKEK